MFPGFGDCRCGVNHDSGEFFTMLPPIAGDGLGRSLGQRPVSR
jgi:hypothetical protein